MKPTTKTTKRESWAWSQIHDHNPKDAKMQYFTGVVGTAFGLVAIYSQGLWSGKATEKYTQLTIIYEGKTSERTVNRAYAQPYLTTMARRFAREVFDGEAIK